MMCCPTWEVGWTAAKMAIEPVKQWMGKADTIWHGVVWKSAHDVLRQEEWRKNCDFGVLWLALEWGQASISGR